MKIKKTLNLPLILLLITLVVFTGSKGIVTVQSVSDNVTATIKISVCGNGIVEGGEDCEGNDLGGETCRSLGYEKGNLNCDVACAFDTSECTGVAPTSTPTPIPSWVPTPTPGSSTAASTKSQTDDSQGKNEDKEKEEEKKVKVEVQILQQPKPELVKLYDKNNDGVLSFNEVADGLSLFTRDWKDYRITKETGAVYQGVPSCDINGDKVCNLIDFSVLMYYVGQ